MAVASPSHQEGRPHSSAWQPDPDSYDDSSFCNYGGPCLAYGESIPCYKGTVLVIVPFGIMEGFSFPPVTSLLTFSLRMMCRLLLGWFHMPRHQWHLLWGVQLRR
jgi:hypothetical protein